MKLLVSVVDAAEARLAVAGGVDIVDAKNPAEGSLGAPAPGVIAQVRDVVPAEMAAERGDRRPALPPGHRRARRGRRGPVGCGVRQARPLGRRLDRRTSPRSCAPRRPRSTATRRWSPSPTPTPRACRARPLAPSELVAAARAAGVSGCLIDTAIKDGRGLLSWLGADALAELVAEAHDAGLEIALAGELRAEDLPTVRATGADIAGVRSAACREGRRTAAIDPPRIAELRAVCAAPRRRSDGSRRQPWVVPANDV